jgi:hypothetical protein
MARVVHRFERNHADASIMELSMEWAGQSSQDRRATVLLRQEYELLLDLFRRQREPADPPIDRDALQSRIVALVELIDRIEREVFFPALPSQYGPLVRSFTAEQEDLSRCLATLRRATANPVRANATGERLEQLAREHLTHQETLLFPAVEREHPDLNCALYDRLVAERPRFAHEEAARVA